MNTITEYKNIAMESLSTMWLEMTKIFPSIIGAIVVLIIGWLVSKLIVKIIKKALKLSKANKLDDKLNEIEIVEGKQLNFDTIKIVSTFVKWMIYIMILIVVSDILNLKIISEQISNFLGYVPQLFVALVIFTLGLLFANFVKKGLQSFFESMDLSGGKIISQIVFFLLVIFISITALNQAGVNTEIITSNLTMILAAFLLSFAIAFGLGAREIIADLLRTFYTRKTYEVGKKIEFKNDIYEVVEISNISVVLKNAEGKHVVPIKDIVENQIKVMD
ncbi:mechanosensitive ion channel family protein [Psychroserpens sp. S379A]|uniref:mechanosensitive ion channel family protein n=1 Tax=Psychroserpens sp. S379A TaxID=3415137 RepID=UPI003C7AA995